MTLVPALYSKKVSSSNLPISSLEKREKRYTVLKEELDSILTTSLIKGLFK